MTSISNIPDVASNLPTVIDDSTVLKKVRKPRMPAVKNTENAATSTKIASKKSRKTTPRPTSTLPAMLDGVVLTHLHNQANSTEIPTETIYSNGIANNTAIELDIIINEDKTDFMLSTMNSTNLTGLDTAERLPFDSALMPKLQKVLADAGVGSRRSMEALIDSGTVKVNGELAYTGQRVLSTDIIQINGKIVQRKHTNKPPRVILYHKPAGEIVSHSDPDGRISVFEKMPRLRNGKWLSVGRLDYNTEGLLIVCNSGDLTNRMMHPRFGLEREYAVRILGDLSDELQTNLRTGIQLEDGIAKFLELSDLGGDGANKWYKVVLTEGKNREVRRLFEAVGVVVSRLIRTRFGPVYLPSRLKRGQLQELDDATSAQLMVTLGVWKDPDIASTSESINNVPRNQPVGRRNQRIETQRLQSGQMSAVNTGRGGERRNRGSRTTQARLQPSYPSQDTNYSASHTTRHNQAAFLDSDRQPASYGGALYTPESGAAGHVDLLAHSWVSPAKTSINRPRENGVGQTYPRRTSATRKPDPMQISTHSMSPRLGQRTNSNSTKTNTRMPRSRKPAVLADDSILGGMTGNIATRKPRTVKFDRMTGEGSSRVGRLTGQSLIKRPGTPAPVVTILKKRKLISEESED